MNKTKKNASRRKPLGEKPSPQRFGHTGGLCRDVIKAKDQRGLATLRYRARWPSPLDLYRDKRIIDHNQYHAGVRFLQSYHRAVSGGAACHERIRQVHSSSTPNVPERIQRALDYVKQAYSALSSDEVSVVIDVCAYSQLAASPEELSLLCKGLESLATEWDMATNEVCRYRKY